MDVFSAYHDPMLRIIEIRQYAEDGTRRASAAWEAVARQPGWIARIALLTFLIIIALPIFALVLLAVITATVIFVVLAGINAIVNVFRGVFGSAALPRRSGRENVRVIRRDDV